MSEQQTETKVSEKVEVAQAQPIETPVVTSSAEEETPQQIDWRKFKAARAEERKAKELAERESAAKSKEVEALKAAMEAIVNRPSAPQGYIQQDQPEEDVIQQKIDAALAKERARVEEDRKQREQKEYPQKVLAAHQDFNEVVTAENMDYLEFHHPEIATAIKYMPEGFDKWSTIYKAIKKHIPNNSTSAKEQKKAEKNMNKPQSMAAGLSGTGDSAPRILDQAAKDANWQRMNRVMKGLPI